MLKLDPQIAAIFQAQWRSRSHQGFRYRWIFYLTAAVWHALFVLFAWLLASVIPELDPGQVHRGMSWGLMAGMFFWQVAPVMMGGSGSSIDLKKLLVYPIAERKLLQIEVLLRLSSGTEVIILLLGAAVGVLRHPQIAGWRVVTLLLFIAMNLALSVGVRDLLERLLARKGVREVVVLLLVSLSALPRFAMSIITPEMWTQNAVVRSLRNLPGLPWPWEAHAAFVSGGGAWWSFPAVLFWLAVSAWFAQRQFHRRLAWDQAEQTAAPSVEKSSPWTRLTDLFFAWPSMVFPDPLAALLEKELRSLSRSPRFRIVFFMGFSFGLVVWAPLSFGRQRSGFMAENFLVVVSLYAALLLGDILFWNCFGFDRKAIQNYLVAPVKFSTVLLAKNLAALYFLLVEITAVAVVCAALRLNLDLQRLLDAYAVALMLGVYMLTAGNLTSVRSPRPVDPSQSWRQASTGRAQLMMLLVYPVIGIPITLAFLARYAFESNVAFYLVVASGYAVGVAAYLASMESALESVQMGQERLVGQLTRGEGPIAG